MQSMELLTTREAARYLRMHPKTLRQKALEGEVPAIRVGGRWRYPREMLDKWISEGCPSPSEQRTQSA